MNFDMHPISTLGEKTVLIKATGNEKADLLLPLCALLLGQK